MNNLNYYIEKANIIHNNKFDYSKFIYTNTNTKGIIICPKHGEFLQSMRKHVSDKRGCRKCFFESRCLTPDQVIKSANEAHNNKYDYSKFVYKNSKTKGIIICPTHGEFLQNIESHIHKHHGCPECGKEIIPNKKDFNQLVIKANQIHNNKYDYSKFIYNNVIEKSIILCPIHKEFYQSMYTHIHKQHGCPKCALENSKLDFNDVVKRFNVVHNDKYDYSKFIYVNANTKGIIICPTHGEFKQNINSHLNSKYGCPECIKENHIPKFEDLLSKSNIIHNYFYNYSKFVYINASTKSIIICPKHGEFLQNMGSHSSGAGCPICNKSHGEKTIMSILNKYNIKYIVEHTYDDLLGVSNKSKLKFDFYLPDYNVLIEFQGKHHYEPNYKKLKDKAWDKFQIVAKHDKMKLDYCKNKRNTIVRNSVLEREISRTRNIEIY
jgi:hypothetical protein